MRKRILAPATHEPAHDASGWLDIERIAEVELTSEDGAHPIESAFRPGQGRGWRAAGPGRQTIRLRFDAPQELQRIRLVFHERAAARTQEFVLRWSAADELSFREIVRQQYTFSPPGTTEEVEDYVVELKGVMALELEIVPDIRGGESRASLSEWLLA